MFFSGFGLLASKIFVGRFGAAQVGNHFFLRSFSSLSLRNISCQDVVVLGVGRVVGDV